MEDWFKWIGSGALAATLAMVGYMINGMREIRNKASRDAGDLHKRIEEIHRDYVRRDDFREYKIENRETLSRIEEKLDVALTRQKAG